MHAGEPADPENYHQHLVDDFQVYTPKYGTYDPKGVKIDLLSFGFYKRLVVDGFAA